MSCLDFHHFYVWWFEFDHSPNKKGMVNHKQYLCYLRHLQNMSSKWCLPTRLGSSPQWLIYLSAPVQLFHMRPRIISTKLQCRIRLCWLCSGDLLICPFLLLFCPLIPSERWFLKARIHKFLLSYLLPLITIIKRKFVCFYNNFMKLSL